MVWKRFRPHRTVRSMLATTRAMMMGTVRKMRVHLTLFQRAPQKTGSAARSRKFFSPTSLGVLMPFQSVKAKPAVSRAGTRMTPTFKMRAGARKSQPFSSLRRCRRGRGLGTPAVAPAGMVAGAPMLTPPLAW